MLETEVPMLRERYWPTAWCAQAHLQTVAGSLLRTLWLPRERYRREVLRLPDGGRVALDWAAGGGDAGTLLVVPGVAGDARADYARCLAAAARRLRLRCVVVNHRGLGGLPPATPRLYCALSHGDLAAAARRVRRRAPGPLLAAGVSLGGLLVAHYLAASGALLAGALAVSAPLDVERGAAALARGAPNALLGRHMARRLRAAAASVRALGAAADWRALDQARSVRAVDAAFTARHFGFGSVDEYYAAATLRGKLARVRAPLLCLCAADDPFQPLSALPLQEAAAGDSVALCVTARGGHIGFLEGWRPLAAPADRQYFARLACQYFGALLRRHAAGAPPCAPAPASAPADPFDADDLGELDELGGPDDLRGPDDLGGPDDVDEFGAPDELDRSA